ncbi:helix-turn-helix domain-containing protein [Burkholderia ambifaria]|uniref:helix-turn-helix domain-containing protein n=1 Tax=Burkholderia ambifaria TaxID=152480 RepID=UPI001FC86A99|nr:helix-turn-helix transcriptional regulator [Burkholderia ambifaria]MDP9587186.1 transcriptional regulator with XRE-family HTH domain [Burkholderia contaminans]
MMTAQIISHSGYSLNAYHPFNISQGIDLSRQYAAMNKMPLRKILARNIRRHMAANEDIRTQVQLAKAAGVAQSSVARVLKGDVDTQLFVIEAIAAAIGVPPGSLLMDDDVEQELLRFNRSLVAALPPSEKAKIESYIEFVLSQTEAVHIENDGSLSISEEVPATSESRRRAGAAAQRPLSNETVSNEKPRREAAFRETKKQRR